MEAILFLLEKCRLCLLNVGVFNIFKSENYDLPVNIYLCTGLKIYPSDNFPEKICNQCLNIVQNAKTLRDRALKNDTHLRSLFVIDGVDKNSVVTEPHQSIHNVTVQSETNECAVNEAAEDKEPRQSIDNVTVKSEINEDTGDEAPQDNQSTPKTSATTNTDDQLDDVHSCKRLRLDDDTIIFECCICYKTFDRWKKLYLHHRLHKKTKICTLEACGKKFSTKGDLEKHLRTHTGEKPYKCNKCDKSFSQRVTLKFHREKVH